MDVVSVPKAAVYEDACPVFPQHKVRMPWQTFVIQPVSESPAPQALSHNKFRLRVLRPDFAHGFAAFFWRDGIHIELNRMDGTDGTDGTDCQTQYSIIYTMRMLGACFLHACEIGPKHAAENAGEVRMMAESMAVGDGKTTRKSRHANGLACPIGGADGRRETLAGQRRSGIKHFQMAT